MDEFPNEILIMVFNNMSIYDMIPLRVVNTHFHDIIDDPAFYNKWIPRDKRLWHNLELSRSFHPQKLDGFKYFYLWYHKYVVYRTSCIRHSYGLIDIDMMCSNQHYNMTMIRLFDFLDELSAHDDMPKDYIRTISEMLIGFDIASQIEQSDNDATPFWELLYGYIQIHCKRCNGDISLLEEFKNKFYTGAQIIVIYRDV